MSLAEHGNCINCKIAIYNRSGIFVKYAILNKVRVLICLLYELLLLLFLIALGTSFPKALESVKAETNH